MAGRLDPKSSLSQPYSPPSRAPQEYSPQLRLSTCSRPPQHTRSHIHEDNLIPANTLADIINETTSQTSTEVRFWDFHEHERQLLPSLQRQIRHIRITVQDFVTWPSMRAGLLVHLTTEEKEAKEAEARKEVLIQCFCRLWTENGPRRPVSTTRTPPHRRREGGCGRLRARLLPPGKCVVVVREGGWRRLRAKQDQLANACDSSGAGHPFHTEKDMV